MLATPIPTHPNQLKAFAMSLLGQLQERDQTIDAQHQSLLDQQRILAERNRELAQRTEELTYTATLVEKLQFELARYQRWRFDKKSEALGTEQIALWEAELDADIEALQKRLDDLQVGLQNNDQDKDKKGTAKRKPKRERLPDSLPRFEVRLEPISTTCACGTPMKRIGEDTAESRQMIPSWFWVKRTVRGKWACRCCESISMAPAPSAPIDKAIAGTSVIAGDRQQIGRSPAAAPPGRHLCPNGGGDCPLNDGRVGRQDRRLVRAADRSARPARARIQCAAGR